MTTHERGHWLSVENTHQCGQVVCVDGGSDVVIHGDSTW
jgi:hypothetical protein